MQKLDKIYLRQAKPDDIKDISEIENKCFSNPWSEKSVKNSLILGNTYFLVAGIGEKIVGYAGMYYAEKEGYIYNIAVCPEVRRCGVGSMLMGELQSFCVKNEMEFLSLEVRASAREAINFYKKFNFKPAGMRRNYYSEPAEDAIIMTLRFAE
jgi:ribosomal-protein-alanine N-acetyltransferase